MTVKFAISALRHRLLRLFRDHLFHAGESLRPILKDLSSRDAIKLQAGQIQLALLQHGTSGLAHILCDNLYPGSVAPRQLVALEALEVFLTVFSLEARQSLGPTAGILHSPAITMTLLTLLLNGSDRTRHRAYDLLTYAPRPLPGLTTPTALNHALSWAVRSLVSARQRESDAGALIIRLIYRVYVRDLGWVIHLKDDYPEPRIVLPEKGVGSGAAQNSLMYLEELLQLFQSKLDQFLEVLKCLPEGNVDDLRVRLKGALGHGVLMSIRYIVEELKLRDAEPSVSVEELRPFVGRLLEELKRALEVSLLVIGNTNFATKDEGEEHDEYKTAAPANPNVAAVVSMDFMVDCRGHLVLDDAEMAEGGLEQMVIMGGWLMAKEVSQCLATLVAHLPLPSADEDGAAGQGALTSGQVADLGQQFLSVRCTVYQRIHNRAPAARPDSLAALSISMLVTSIPLSNP